MESVRSIIKAVGAIMSSLTAAVGLGLDFVQVVGIDTKWWTILAFLIFCGFVIWIIVDYRAQIKKLESGRPEIVCGKRMGVTIASVQGHLSDITLKLLFSNIGKKKAYQFKQKVSFAPRDNLESFKKMEDITSANPINPGDSSDHGRNITFRQTIGVAPISWLIYTGIEYSDSEIHGNWYKDEYWFCYHVGNEYLSNATLEEKVELEPYVRANYPSSRTLTC